MKTEFNFVDELMALMRKCAMIPKVQVERIAGPIFTLFIEEVVSKLLETHPNLSGEVHLVAPEFPLKKQANNQSTNIDWLLVNPEKKSLLLVELKTDIGSIKGKQLDNYRDVIGMIHSRGGEILIDGVNCIFEEGTIRGPKYDFLLEKLIKPLHNEISNADSGHILYFVPDGTPNNNIEEYRYVHIYSFSQLPIEISGPKNEIWQKFRKTLCELSYTAEEDHETKRDEEIDSSVQSRVAAVGAPSQRYNVNYSEKVNIYRTAAKNWKRGCDGDSGKNPIKIWFGISGGTGIKPNFQIEFDDGEIRCYSYKGKRRKERGFNPSNIRGPFDFQELSKNNDWELRLIKN